MFLVLGEEKIQGMFTFDFWISNDRSPFEILHEFLSSDYKRVSGGHSDLDMKAPRYRRHQCGSRVMSGMCLMSVIFSIGQWLVTSRHETLSQTILSLSSFVYYSWVCLGLPQGLWFSLTALKQALQVDWRL